MENITSLIINRILRNNRANDIMKAEGYLFSMKIENQYILLDYVNRYQPMAQYEEPEYQVVMLDYHAFNRWNSRVGPVIKYEVLQTIMNIIFLHQPFRLSFLKHGIGTIDDDIVFTYEIRGIKLLITTFYGRKIIQPSLNQINNLRKYNLYNNEYVNLSLSEDILNNQIVPPIPRQCIHFHGSKTKYILEGYELKDMNDQYFICYQKHKNNEGPFKVIGIDIRNPNQELLANNILYIFHRFGYSEFVYNHLRYHKPQKVAKTYEKLLAKINEANELYGEVK